MKLFSSAGDEGAGGEGDEGGGAGDWRRVIAVQDRASGLRALIVLHSLARGPAFGGVRRRAYASEAEALAEVKRLAAAMSLKCALAGLAAGGGKTVILDHPRFDREAGYAALGQAIAELDGRYWCGPDVGTGPEELAQLRRATRFVNPEANDPGRATAAGVLAGLRGLSQLCFGDAQLGARRYIIQGLGSVGAALAGELLAAGAEVAGWDCDPAARRRAAELGVSLLDADTVLREPCDVFMPCALGGVLDRRSCAEGPWRAVCGSANNQLTDAGAGELLHRRGIAWAPDFVVNAGAVIEGVETVRGPAAGARERVAAAIEAIAPRCAAILEQARREDRPPAQVALARARSALGEGSLS